MHGCHYRTYLEIERKMKVFVQIRVVGFKEIEVSVYNKIVPYAVCRDLLQSTGVNIIYDISVT